MIYYGLASRMKSKGSVVLEIFEFDSCNTVLTQKNYCNISIQAKFLLNEKHYKTQNQQRQR